MTFARLPLYPKQRAIVDDPARFTFTEATTKSGKTMSHVEWLFDTGIRAGEGNWWWVAPTSGIADIAYRRAKQRLDGFLDSGGKLMRVADPIPFEKNETKKLIEVDGAAFWFKSALDPDSLYGEDVRGAVGDEFSRWRYEAAWHALYSTLAATRGQAKLIGNVKGKRFAYHLGRKAHAGEPGWAYYKLTWRDAVEGGILDPLIVEQARRDLPPQVFRELFEAEPADDGTNPFGLEAIRACIGIPSSLPPVVHGIDLGSTLDWTVDIGLDRRRRVSFFNRFQADWRATENELRRDVGELPALVDATGVGKPVLEHLQEDRPGEGPRWNFTGERFSPEFKQQIMGRLATAIHKREVVFPADSPACPIVSELESFEFEYTATGVRYSAPDGMHDDCVMAIALALQHGDMLRLFRSETIEEPVAQPAKAPTVGSHTGKSWMGA